MNSKNWISVNSFSYSFNERSDRNSKSCSCSINFVAFDVTAKGLRVLNHIRQQLMMGNNSSFFFFSFKIIRWLIVKANVTCPYGSISVVNGNVYSCFLFNIDPKCAATRKNQLLCAAMEKSLKTFHTSVAYPRYLVCPTAKLLLNVLSGIFDHFVFFFFNDYTKKKKKCFETFHPFVSGNSNLITDVLRLKFLLTVRGYGFYNVIRLEMYNGDVLLDILPSADSYSESGRFFN